MDRTDFVDVEPTPPEPSWQTYLESGDTATALQRYRDDAGRTEETLDALKALSEVRYYTRAKRWAKARRVLAKVETPPRSVTTIVDWAELGEQLSELEATSKLLDKHDAEAVLTHLQRITSPLLRAEAETQRGTAHIFLNELDQAEAAFARALDQDPKHYRALTNSGNLHLEADRVDEAIVAYEAALRLNEDFANAHHNLGVAYRRKGQISRSVRSIRRAQKAMRQQDTEEAKGSLSGTLGNLNRRLGGRGLRYVLYGLGALLLLWWLRVQGLI